MKGKKKVNKEVKAREVVSVFGGHRSPPFEDESGWFMHQTPIDGKTTYGCEALNVIVRSMRRFASAGDTGDIGQNTRRMLDRILGAGVLWFRADLDNFEGLMLASRPPVTGNEAVYLVRSHRRHQPGIVSLPQGNRQMLYMVVCEQYRAEPGRFLDKAGVEALLAKILRWSDAQIVSIAHSIYATHITGTFGRNELQKYFRIKAGHFGTGKGKSARRA